MYMPRLRARQHEVLAVMNCAASFASASKVVPILEPVDAPTPLFARRLEAISEAGTACDLILNPSVGTMSSRDSWRRLGAFYLEHSLLEHHGVAVLSNADADHAAMANWIEGVRRQIPRLTVDIVHERDLSTSLQGTTYRGVRWNIAEDRTVPSTYGLPLSGRPVVWDSDPFPVQERNRDYVGRVESIFSTRVTGYKSAGYVGVSDFLTVGRGFHRGGGPAYAVVIHFTYELQGTIRLRHFCSDSNDTQDDPGGKFLEALDKLVGFIQSNRIVPNTATDAFASLHRDQHFPGLGKVKELSMMNHMLVMQAAV